MKANGESIYGTTASPIGSADWGRVHREERRTTARRRCICTCSTGRRMGNCRCPDCKTKFVGRSLLATGEALAATKSKGVSGITIELPRAAVDPMDTVIALEIDGPVKLGL